MYKLIVLSIIMTSNLVFASASEFDIYRINNVCRVQNGVKLVQILWNTSGYPYMITCNDKTTWLLFGRDTQAAQLTITTDENL